MKNIFTHKNRILWTASSVSVFIALLVMLVEPGRVGAVAASDTIVVTLNVTAGITITSPADVTMSTNLGVTQNSAIGTTTWNVKTNNNLGYTLAVRATSTPAMQTATGSSMIADYQTGAPNTWVATTGNAYFGYSAYGTDIPTGTWGAQGSGGCSATSTAHSTSSSLKYKGFTTSDVTVATRSSTTTTAGIDSTFCFAVDQNNFYIPAGTYTATIIATATTL